MYGVESFVHPDYQGAGVGSALLKARFETAHKVNVVGLVAGSLIAGYHAVAHEVSAEVYVQDVIAGRRFDLNLSKQLRKGFKVRNLIPEYTEDARSLNWGVAILWENPEYDPSKAAINKMTSSYFEAGRIGNRAASHHAGHNAVAGC